jgi:hypothetical protein
MNKARQVQPFRLSLRLPLILTMISFLAHPAIGQTSRPGDRQTPNPGIRPRKIIAYDFESPLDVQGWWVDNKAIRISQCGVGDCDQLPGSGQCLRIQWDPVASGKANTWMTDIKIDTFGDSAVTGNSAVTGSPVWKMVKVRLNSLHFDNWGKGNIAEPDLRSMVPSRIEIGLRSPQAAGKGKIDLRIDNIAFTNYEP